MKAITSFVVVWYILLVICFSGNAKAITVIVCEHTNGRTVACPPNQQIHVKYAMYGRLVSAKIGACARVSPPKNRCVSQKSLPETKRRCDGNRNCLLEASNTIYGDPCVGTRKYLEVKYECLSNIRTNFETPPTISNAKNPKLGQRLTIQGCQFFDNTGRRFNGTWTRDKKIISESVAFEKLQASYFVLNGLTLETTTIKDEGNYRCALLTNGEMVTESGELQILFKNVSRVQFNLEIFKLASRKKRSTDAETTDDITIELRKRILQASPSSSVRFVTNFPSITIIVSVLKKSENSDVILFDQLKFLLDITKIGKHDVFVQNNEYCPAETIGSVNYKGQYSYPSVKQGTEVIKICVHGSMNVEKKSFTRMCQSTSSGKTVWSTPDISHCLAETKTTQGLIDLNAKPICTKAKQKNCQTLETVSKNLTSIVSSAAVVSIPEDVELVSQIVAGIADNIQTAVTPEETKKILDDVLDVTSSISETKPEVVSVAEKTDKASNSFRQSLDTIGGHVSNVLPSGKTLQASSRNIGFVATKTTRKDIEIASQLSDTNTLIASVNTQNPLAAKDAFAKMNIPKSALQQQNNNKLYSYTFRNDAFFKADTAETTGSVVIAATINNKKIQNLQTPINITFKLTDPSILQRNPNCSFWNEIQDVWSTEGVTSSGAIGSTYLCQTNHLTNFALIIDVSQTQANPLALQFITWIGCGISLAGLILTIFSYLLFKRLRRKLVPRLLICLSFSLMCTILIFLFGVEETGSSIGCQVIAGLLHYFLLVSFSWMAVQGINLYRSLVQIFNSNISSSQFFLRSFLMCTGVPAVVVIVTGSVRSDDYGGKNLCLVTGVSFFATLLAPVVFILVLNIVLLVLVLRGIRNTQLTMKSNKRASGSDNDHDHDDPKRLAKITIACSILLGLTWLFGVLAVGELTTVMQYLFCIFNSLQGFFIFIFYTLTNPDVRKEWKVVVGWETLSSTFSQATKRVTQYTTHTNTKTPKQSTSSNTSTDQDTSRISYTGNDEEVRYSNPPPQMPYRSANINISRGKTNQSGGISYMAVATS